MFAKWGVKPLNPAAGSSPRFIITLTSYGERVEKSVFYAVCSLLSQSEAPEKIVLYLAHGTEIPRKLEELKRCGLEIRFCDDLKSYKKLVPALLEFPDDVLITADDDIFYPRKWLKALKAAYIENPRAIHCHRAHEIRVYEDGSLRPYSEWNFMSAGFCCNESVFPTTGGGVLYPPHSLDGRCTDEKLFLKLAPKADDVWFWAMANLKGTECAVIKNGFNAASEVVPNDQNGLCVSNVNGGGNDRQLKAVVEAFPELKKVFEKIKSFDSADYWEGRYAQGGNSGAGSRDKLAAFKAGIINSFVAERSIKTVMEFGCGDGGQLLLADYPFYTGFDVSDTALEKCRKLFTAGGGGGANHNFD
ncbi:MAG: class I SAM-dependent methyltransferase [Spirochaetaceae bacterium]|nr:class I SAM-dependent methyltransferase [Spirochaetaceae bacterium]